MNAPRPQSSGQAMPSVLGFEEFASVISGKMQAPSKETAAILKRIEKNTKEKISIATLADPSKIRTGPGSMTRRGRLTGYGTATRDAHGRFATTASGNFPGTRQEGSQGIIGVIQRGFQMATNKVKSDAGKEVIGKAIGGPLFEAAMEIKDARDRIKEEMADERSVLGKGAKWAKKKAGISSEPTVDAKIVDKSTIMPDITPSKPQGEASGESLDKIVGTLMKSEKSDEDRHKELVAAIIRAGKPDPRSMDLPSPRETGPGSTEKRRSSRSKGGKNMQVSKTTGLPKGGGKMGGLSMLPGATLPGGNRPAGGGLGLDGLASMAMKVAPALAAMAALPLGAIAAGVGATAAAIGAVGAAGYSAVTGKDNFISKGAQKLGLVPKLETDASGKVVAGAVATASESGKGGAGTISTGKNDAGGASYGKKQFASAGGDKSPVAQFVKSSSHAKEFEGLPPGTPEFNKKWKDVAASDKNFGAEQDAYVAKTMSAPVLAKAVKGGFNSQDVGVREALISQSVNHGPGGNKKILEGAQAELSRRYGSVEAAPVTDQIDALTASRKQYVNQVAENKTVTAQKLRAKGDEKGALKAEGEAKQLKQMAGVGGRYDKENAIEKDLSATGGIVGKTAIAQKAKAIEPSLMEGEAVRQTATTAEISNAPPASVTATPVAGARKRIMAGNRERLATAGAGSLAPKVIEGIYPETTLAKAVPGLQPPVTSLATSATSRPSPPERIQPARIDEGAPAKQMRGSNQVIPDMGGVFMAALDKLNATVAKLSSGDETTRTAAQQIRTEFDDTMLTLMAYDRI